MRQNEMIWGLALLVALGMMLGGGLALAGKPLDFNTAQKLALHGDASDYNNLGMMYFNGEYAPKDYQQAVVWFRKAANYNHAEALVNLGMMYEKGHGVPQDYNQATNWYRKAAEQGHKKADSHIRQIADGIASITSAAKEGAEEAQMTLADLFANGNGVSKSDDQAAEWYRKAAEHGNAKAQYKLGLVYAEGKGVSQDYEQSVAWYRKAIAQDYAPAKYGLSGMYFKGKGVPKDKVQAYAWLSLAAAQGDGNANSNKEFAASKLTPAQLTEAETLAAQYKSKIDSQKK